MNKVHHVNDSVALFCKVLYPSIGGMEEAARLLHRAFLKAGVNCTLITQTPRPEGGISPLDETRVSYVRSIPELVQEIQRCGTLVSFGPNVRAMGAALFARRPMIVSHHNFYRTACKTLRNKFENAIRDNLCAHAEHTFVSRAIRRSCPFGGVVIPNPYDHELYYRPIHNAYSRDVIFVGRLIPDKGTTFFASFLRALEHRVGPITFTVVGDGSERHRLEQELGALQSDVLFTGALKGRPLADCLAMHKVSIIPSDCDESFGLVALEAIASGCIPVAFDRGGLSEAIGDCGLLVPPSNIQQLTSAVFTLLRTPNRRLQLLKNRDTHLSRHEPNHVAETWLGVLNRL